MLFFRKPPTTPLTITTAHRRAWLRQAFSGASAYERESLIRQALATLPNGEAERLVRQLDREIWMEQKP